MHKFEKLPLLNKLVGFYLNKLRDDAIERSLPAQWSYMHLFSSVQIAKMVSVKRGLDYRKSVLCVAFHDIATIIEGTRKDHAAIGATMIESVLSGLYDANPSIEGVPPDDLELIKSAVDNHSDKSINSQNPYDEFTKDVDAFDRHLHGLETDDDGMFRVKRVADELTLAL
jgi:HD superfamily phosphodiesterase